MSAKQHAGPWSDSDHGGPWTRHGHSIPGRTVLGERRPGNVARCGGVALCRTCQGDAEQMASIRTTVDRSAEPDEAFRALLDRIEAAPEADEAHPSRRPVTDNQQRAKDARKKSADTPTEENR